jgi:hypothetical protein
LENKGAAPLELSIVRVTQLLPKRRFRNFHHMVKSMAGEKENTADYGEH